MFAELERPEVLELVSRFADEGIVARHEAQRRSLRDDQRDFSHYHRARVFLGAAIGYCEAVARLAAGLDQLELSARALASLRDHLGAYVAGEPFTGLREQATGLARELDDVRYSLMVKGARISVGPYQQQADYSEQVATTFERFRQHDADESAAAAADREPYAAVGVLHLVAKVFPELFGRLDAFCARHAGYLDDVVRVVDRELQFYLGYREYVRPLRDAGLSLSSPRVSSEDKAEQVLDTFDLALAAQRVAAGEPVVVNDLTLDAGERLLVITGPNSGGKTTMARTVGQLHYLARLGCPVAGRDARLFVCDRIFTRFERREDPSSLEGKLQDELHRIRDALALATPRSLFVLNEMFNSTTAYDALALSREILLRVRALDALCVAVTFLDELATFDDATVSMVSEVDPSDPAIRTYRVTRRAADGRAYARAIAKKHGLTYERLMRDGRP